MPKFSVAFLAFLWIAGPALAAPPELKGDFVQGGLVFGRTDPDTKISLNGRQSPSRRMAVSSWVSVVMSRKRQFFSR